MNFKEIHASNISPSLHRLLAEIQQGYAKGIGREMGAARQPMSPSAMTKLSSL